VSGNLYLANGAVFKTPDYSESLIAKVIRTVTSHKDENLAEGYYLR
jgi:hypothetical protein